MTNSAATLRRASPPLAQGLPLLGSVLDMSRDIRAFLTEQYLKLGPVFRLRLLHRKYTVLAGPEANVFASTEGSGCLGIGDAMDGIAREMGAKTFILNIDGPDHLRLRELNRRAFSGAFLREHAVKAIGIARRQVAEWPLEKPVLGLYSLQRIAAEQTGTLQLGASPRDYINDIFVYGHTMLMVRAARLRPGLMLYMPRYRNAARRVDELLEQVWKAHEPGMPRDAGSRDLVDDMLAATQSDPDIVARNDLKAALMSPLFVGVGPVGATCSVMLYQAIRHPDIMKQMTDEADDFFANANGASGYSDLGRLGVLHRVALEALRMYPPFPAVPRIATESFDFGGYSIPKGESVILATTVPHYLPQLFPDPERFDIDRYLPERMEHRQPGALTPWGAGPHTCLGDGFAELQVVLIVATILHEVELELDPPDGEVRFRLAGMYAPDDSLKFRVRRRRNPASASG